MNCKRSVNTCVGQDGTAAEIRIAALDNHLYNIALTIGLSVVTSGQIVTINRINTGSYDRAVEGSNDSQRFNNAGMDVSTIQWIVVTTADGPVGADIVAGQDKRTTGYIPFDNRRGDVPGGRNNRAVDYTAGHELFDLPAAANCRVIDSPGNVQRPDFAIGTDHSVQIAAPDHYVLDDTAGNQISIQVAAYDGDVADAGISLDSMSSCSVSAGDIQLGEPSVDGSDIGVEIPVSNPYAFD